MNYEYCDGVTHTVKKGDTLYEISRKYNVALALLLRANPYVDVFNLQVGDTICIPTGQEQMTPYPISSRREQDDDRDDGRRSQSGMGNMPNQGNVPSGMRNMPNQRNTQPEAGIMSGRGREELKPEEVDTVTSRRGWEKYVVQPGDTFADILQEMDGDAEDFLEKNNPSTIYMLPGVAYYIRRQDRR